MVHQFPTENPSHLAYHKRNQEVNLPIGQVKIRMRYLHYKSEWFSLYLPTPEEFRNVTQKAGWKITVALILHKSQFTSGGVNSGINPSCIPL